MNPFCLNDSALRHRPVMCRTSNQTHKCRVSVSARRLSPNLMQALSRPAYRLCSSPPRLSSRFREALTNREFWTEFSTANSLNFSVTLRDGNPPFLGNK